MDKKENSGFLFPNNKKNDRQPDYRGEAKVGSIEFFMSMWKKNSKSGNEYFSVAFTEIKDSDKDKASTPKNDTFFDDEIPFD
jgi:uncharacterized protein (DUF736 family)|nr:MAG TPA: Protein of unknown function (DUF736) [Caudoviricetes sp.]